MLAGCAFVGVSPRSAELQAVVGSAGSDLRCGGAGARHESSLRVTSRSAEQRVCRPPASQSGPAVRAGTMRWCVVYVALCALLPAAARACDCCSRNATAAECGVDARLEPRRDCACCAVCAVQKGGLCDDQLRPCQRGLECGSQGVCTGESARTLAGFQPRQPSRRCPPAVAARRPVGTALAARRSGGRSGVEPPATEPTWGSPGWGEGDGCCG